MRIHSMATKDHPRLMRKKSFMAYAAILQMYSSSYPKSTSIERNETQLTHCLFAPDYLTPKPTNPESQKLQAYYFTIFLTIGMQATVW